MNLTEYLAHLKDDLSLTTELTDGELVRCLYRAVEDLSRLSPREMVHDATLIFTVTNEAFTTAAAHGTYVSLASKPIEPGSALVRNTAHTTTYVLDTDYTMDYANGQITTISTGAMAVSTTYHISYTKHQVSVDLSSLSTTRYRIFKVAYPAGQVPENLRDASLWGHILTLQADRDSQAKLTANKHAWIYYQIPHTPPTVDADPTYPPAFDELVTKGAAAYAIMQLGMKQYLLGSTDLATARTRLGSCAALHTTLTNPTTGPRKLLEDAVTACGTVLTSKVTTDGTGSLTLSAVALAKVGVADTGPLALASARIAAAHTGATSPIGWATTGLGVVLALLAAGDAVDVALDKAETYAGATGTTAPTVLGTIITDLTTLNLDITNIGTSIDTEDDNLAKVAALLTTALDPAKDAADDLAYARTELAAGAGRQATVLEFLNSIAGNKDSIKKELDQVSGVWTEEVKHLLTSALPNAQGFLDLGDDAINTVNVGAGVADLYSQYAQVALAIADKWKDKREAFLSAAQRWADAAQIMVNSLTQDNQRALGYVESANAGIATANAYIAEALARSSASRNWINRALARVAQVEQRVAAAQALTSVANTFISEATQRLVLVGQKLAEVASWLSTAANYLEQANAYITIAATYIQEASGRVAEARAYIEVANTRLSQATQYSTEIQGLLGELQSYTTEADKYHNSATATQALAESYAREAMTRRTEFTGLLSTVVNRTPMTAVYTSRQSP